MIPSGIATFHAVADFDIFALPEVTVSPTFEPRRSDNVGFSAIRINQKSNKSIAVRIVFKSGHLSDDIIFVSLEIDETVHCLVAAAFMTAGNVALIVASAFMRKRT
jgi:hypothetical protein